jgi:hypothetical protein
LFGVAPINITRFMMFGGTAVVPSVTTYIHTFIPFRSVLCLSVHLHQRHCPLVTTASSASLHYNGHRVDNLLPHVTDWLTRKLTQTQELNCAQLLQQCCFLINKPFNRPTEKEVISLVK